MISFLLAVALQTTQLSASNYKAEGAMTPPTGVRPIWADEFDGRALDLSKWRYDTSRNKEGWYNEERQYYAAGRARNVRVADGRLILEAHKEKLAAERFPDWGGQDYTSGKLVTKDKASWTYGFFEVRAKLPCGRGTWPAIWMLPDKGSWPTGGEIDILEHIGSEPNQIHATLHTELFTHSKGTQRGATRELPTACSAFHRYQLDWRPDVITIGVDGRAYMRIRDTEPGGRGAWPFDRPFHLILNLAMGGNWAGAKGIDDTALPERMEVDYVRIWQEPK